MQKQRRRANRVTNSQNGFRRKFSVECLEPKVLLAFDVIHSGGHDWGGGNFATSIAFGDVDGDGRDEMAVTRQADQNARYALYDDAANDFRLLAEFGQQWGGGNYATSIAFGDVDGDGRDEFGVARRSDRNARYFVHDDAVNGFSLMREFGREWGGGSFATSIAFGDIDGDGRDEMGVTRQADRNGRYFIHDDAFAGFALWREFGREWGGGNFATSIAFGDIDGDGRDELGITRHTDRNGRYFIHDDALANFALWREFGREWGGGNFATSIAFGDVDGDGRDEFGVTRRADRNGRYFIHDDAFADFVLRGDFGREWGGGNFATSIAFGDADGDGRDEFAVARQANQHGRYLMHDDALLGYQLLDSGGETWGGGNYATSVAFGDVCGDGLSDIGVSRKSDQNARFLIANGSANRDTDGDGLLDEWETYGFDVNNDCVVDLDLPALGADPLQKDLFVEVDVMQDQNGGDSLAPNRIPTTPAVVASAGLATNTVLDWVIASFLNAPVANPNGRTGIRLHVEIDDTDIPFQRNWPLTFDLNSDGVADWPGAFDIVKGSFFGTRDQRSSSNLGNILYAKTLAYRYNIFANGYDGNDSTGLARSNDFLVTLGLWPVPGGTNDQQAGTFMHELGHTLGLTHGGNDNVNCKPNYHSVMNYLWQFPLNGNAASWTLDYSRFEAPPLNEAALIEATGIGIPAGTGHDDHLVLVGGTIGADEECQNRTDSADRRFVPEVGPVDWDLDGDFGDTVNQDINGDGQIGILKGHNDWRAIRYEVGSLGASGASGFVDPSGELTHAHFEVLNSADRVVGDSNGDRRFDTTDLVLTFQSGKYGTTAHASWTEGDWNADGHFNSGDIVAAFRAGTFETDDDQRMVGSLPVFRETDGRVVVEAEDFPVTFKSFETRQQWTIVETPADSLGTPFFQGARGHGYIQLLPNGLSRVVDVPTAGTPPFVEYPLQIDTPGRYRLYLRWDGFDGASNSLYASIPELWDGAGGQADWYRYAWNGDDVDFRTNPWDGSAGFERTDAGGNDVDATWDIRAPGVYSLRIDAREDGAALDAFVLQLDSLPTPHDPAPDVPLFEEVGGQIFVEAENSAISRESPTSSHRWEVVNVPEDSEGTPFFLGFSGSGYIQALPSGFGRADEPSVDTPPYVEYPIQISTPGRYRLFLRWDGFNGISDSVYVSIPELRDGTGGQADWYRYSWNGSDNNFVTDPWHGMAGFELTDAGGGDVAATWDIKAPGVYTIRIDVREYGAAVDAFMLQLDALPHPG